MKIGFHYEYGSIPEVGFGHKFRAETIIEELRRRGHRIEIVKDILMSDIDVLVIDHVLSCNSLILRANAGSIKTVLIDGVAADADNVDESISAFFNDAARYRGVEYICFPTAGRTNFYSVEKKTKNIFVGFGGFDPNNLAEKVVSILKDLSLRAIVVRGVNHNFACENMEFYNETNYYDAMSECVMGITNGGLTMFQAMHFGLPCLCIPQYKHQSKNILGVSGCCLTCDPEPELIKENVKKIINDEYLRLNLSLFGSYRVDGKGCSRICNIIEGIL